MRPENLLTYFPDDFPTDAEMEAAANREALRLAKLTRGLKRAMATCQAARVGPAPGQAAEMGEAVTAIRKALQYLERGV